jgi:hypothetical protein
MVSVIFDQLNPIIMKAIFIFTLFIMLFAIANAQQIVHFKKNAVPAAMKYKGKFNDAIKYSDKEGAHIVITTSETVATPADDNENVYTATLHAFSYLKTGNGVMLEWQLNDSAGPCAADVDARLRPGSLSVTDLDHNGVDEVWFVYRLSCHETREGNPMKVIVHEGVKKYAMRGTTKLKLKVTPAKYTGGDYTFDENFNAAPQSFRHHAIQLWMKNRDEVALY